jgi:hypothetical protein
MKTIKLISLSIIIASLTSCGGSSTPATEQVATTQTDTRVKSGQNRFVLTHCLGKKLDKVAHFYVDGAKWKLDYNNGEKIYYTVISGNEATPLCGINTVDNFKEDCEICITKDGINSIVQFKYGKGTISFDGYYDK